MKKIALLLCVLLLIGMLPAIGQAEGELRVAWFGNQKRHDMMNQICDNFEAKYNVKVIREFASTSDYWNRLTTQVAGKNAPDLFVMQYDRFENYVSRGQLMELSELVNNGMLDVSKFAQGHIKNGMVGDGFYGVSLGGSVRTFVYNTVMFEKAGIEVQEDWLWEDFIEAGRKIKEAYPDCYLTEDITLAPDCLQTYIRASGHNFFEGNALGFPKQVLIDYLNMGIELREKGYIPSPEIQVELGDKSQPDSMLAKGMIAMIAKPSNQLPLYQKVMDDHLDCIPFPRLTKEVIGDWIGSTNWVIPVYSKNAELACKFLNYFSNTTEAVDLWQVELGPLPNTEMSDYIASKLDDSSKRMVEYVNDMLTKITPVAGFPDNGSEVLNGWRSVAEKVAYGIMTPEAAVDEFFANAELLLMN